MAFHEVQFPVDIGYGSRGGPGFKTDIIAVDSGAEQRTSRWETPLRQFDVSYGVKSRQQLTTLITFYLARKGAQYGFRYKDFSDFRSSADGISATTKDDQEIGVGDGVVTTFQLIKTYTSGNSVTRTITKPVTGTVKIAKDGVNQTSGWTADYTTGIITFSSAPADDVVITAGFEFDVPVRFGEGADTVLQATQDDFSNGSFASGITLMEIRDGLTVYDEFFAGGAWEEAISAHKQISLSQGRLQVFNPSTSELHLLLPDKTDIPPGGPILYLINEGADSLLIKDGATTVATLGAGAAYEMLLSVDVDDNKVWYAI